MRRLAIGLGITLFPLAAVACGETSTSSSVSPSAPARASASATPSATPSATAEPPPSPTSLGGVNTNYVSAKDLAGASTVAIRADTDNGINYFSPTVITGTPGQKVTVTLTNGSTSVPHNFTVVAQAINQDLAPGATATVTVTLPASGTLAFRCEYHTSSGMNGQFRTS